MWMTGRPWGAAELHEFELALVEGMTIGQIARSLMRSAYEVTCKIRELKAAKSWPAHAGPESVGDRLQLL